jgi:hypothetical protein
VPGSFTTGCTCGYSYSTLSGLACVRNLFHRLHLWLFIFNPFRVGAGLIPKPTGFTFSGKSFAPRNFCLKGYSYSTLSGLACVRNLFHRLHLWLFIFNPFRVGVCPEPFPQVAPVAIHIQPLQGWRVSGTFSTGFTKAIHTPSG